MTNTTDSIMLRLRSETQDLHTEAEKQPIQQRMLQGSLPKEFFVDFLCQMLVVHRELESHLRRWRFHDSRFGAVLRDEQFRERNLIADLEFFGLDVDAAAARTVTATRRAAARISQTAEERPVALLGYHYVLEGSTNGAKFIARGVQKAYGLEPGPGTTFLDPHGPAQKERWDAFKREMDALEFTHDEREAIVEAAKDTFRAMIQICAALDGGSIAKPVREDAAIDAVVA